MLPFPTFFKCAKFDRQAVGNEKKIYVSFICINLKKMSFGHRRASHEFIFCCFSHPKITGNGALWKRAIIKEHVGVVELCVYIVLSEAINQM